MNELEQLLEQARAGYFNKNHARTIPASAIKEELMESPEFRAEYERLRPEFQLAQAKIDTAKKAVVHRTSNGRRAYLMDYIPPMKNGKNPLYAAVMFARELMREGQSPDYANGWAAKKYRVKKSDVAHYTGQVAGTVSGLRRGR